MEHLFAVACAPHVRAECGSSPQGGAGKIADTETPAVNPASVLAKVALILDALSAADGTLGLSELARRSGVAKSSVHRLCGELVEWGVVERIGDGFRLGPKLFELGAHVPSQRRIRDLALPYLQRLLISTGHTIHLVVHRGESNLYLEKLEMQSTTPTPTQVGERVVLHASATGKAVLAFGDPGRTLEILARPLEAVTPNTIVDSTALAADLALTRRRGYSIEREEFVVGFNSVAAPLFEVRGRVLGAVSVTAGSQVLEVAETARQLCMITTQISQRLGHRGTSLPQ